MRPRLGLAFGPGQPIVVDPVPRLLDGAEWEALEAGLVQRAQALNAFLADVYGEQRIFAAGVVPDALLETASGYEPQMRGLLDPAVPAATVAGLDLVRDAGGELLVLEDNLRMPSGATYSLAVREAVAPELGAVASGRGELRGYVGLLGAAIARRRPGQTRRAGRRDPLRRRRERRLLRAPPASAANSGSRSSPRASWS